MDGWMDGQKGFTLFDELVIERAFVLQASGFRSVLKIIAKVLYFIRKIF
jgi:hypothetical protein